MNGRWRRWKYKHLTYFLVSLLVVGVLSKVPHFHDLMHKLAQAGYWGAFIGGILYISSFTAAIGALLLISLTETVPIIPLCLLAGLGGLVGDLLIFKFIRSEMKNELHRLYDILGGTSITRLFKRNKPLSWLVPILGAVVIASPLPDEIGISMLGVTQIRMAHFSIMAFVLDIVGVFALVTLAA
jgi:hypothetical protein